jgi:large subunit ribosomal protein L3
MKGLIGKKIGMTQYFEEDGSVVPVTVIEAGPCYVTQVKTVERDGYSAVQLGFDEIPQRSNGNSRLVKAEQGHLRRNGASLPDLRVLREFRAEQIALNYGDTITCEVFSKGDVVDVVGTSKGRGFAGTIKRHNFNRGPHTHGQSDRERSPGSIGASSSPSRVLKNMRMSGHMGDERVTIQNLEVVLVDASKNLLAVKGSVPGHRGGIVIIKPSRKQRKSE